jgi:hypothetical protein
MTTTDLLPAEPFHLSTGGHGSVFEGEACFNELGAAAAAAVADRGWKVSSAVYSAVREKMRELVKPQTEALLPSALELLDRMLPETPLMVPVVSHAEVICAAPDLAVAA